MWKELIKHTHSQTQIFSRLSLTCLAELTTLLKQFWSLSVHSLTLINMENESQFLPVSNFHAMIIVAKTITVSCVTVFSRFSSNFALLHTMFALDCIHCNFVSLSFFFFLKAKCLWMCTEHNSEGLWDSYSLKSHQHCSSALLLQYYHATTLSSDTSYVDNDSTMNCWRFCPRQYVSPPYIIKLVHQPPIIPTVNISFLHIKTSQHPLTASTKKQTLWDWEN